MALVCMSCHAGLVRSRMDVSKLSSVYSGSSLCHIVVFRSPNICTQVISDVNLVWPKTTRVWDNSGDLCALRRSREGLQRHGQWRAALSNPADKPTGISGERTTNGGVRTVGLNHLQKVDSNMEEGIEGKFPANPSTIISKDISTKGSSNTDTGDRVIPSAETVETSSYGLSKLSAFPQSDRSGNLQENFRERDKGISDAEAEKYVSLVWEAGSEIEKVTPAMASLQNKSSTEDKDISSKVEEERHRQERLKALEGILANFPDSESDLNAREAELLAFADKLMNQSALHEEAYRRSQEALHMAEGMVFRLNTQVRQLTEDVASRDSVLRLLQKEASVSSESLQRAAQSLCDAERRIIHLEKEVKAREQTLWEGRDKLTAAVKVAGSLEEAAKVADNKLAELEVSSLKALAAAGSRAEYLSAQVKALEQELKSRDFLLLEVKAETKRNTEALTIAAQIKQDLNSAREREVQLTQALESANYTVKELQTELSENLRSLRAEQALRQIEKMLGDANLEVQRLRKGVEERDKSIFLMKDEVDLNIGLLNNAARDREEVHKMKLQVEDLKAELGSKDNKLKIMREEMASVINLARQKQSTLSGTSSSDHASIPGAGSIPAVQVSKPKKKIQSKKQTGSQRSSPSPQSS